MRDLSHVIGFGLRRKRLPRDNASEGLEASGPQASTKTHPSRHSRTRTCESPFDPGHRAPRANHQPAASSAATLSKYATQSARSRIVNLCSYSIEKTGLIF